MVEAIIHTATMPRRVVVAVLRRRTLRTIDYDLLVIHTASAGRSATVTSNCSTMPPPAGSAAIASVPPAVKCSAEATASRVVAGHKVGVGWNQTCHGQVGGRIRAGVTDGYAILHPIACDIGLPVYPFCSARVVSSPT